MKRTSFALLLLSLICAGALALLNGAAAADGPPGGDDWKYDIVYRKKGDSYRGLIFQRGGEVQMWCIVRKPGRPTVFYRVHLSQDEIERVEMLPDEEHEVLRRRFEALREEHRQLSDPLKALQFDKVAIPGADKIKLHETPWRGDPKIKGLTYRSSHFELESNAARRVVLVAAGQLEQVYAAYVRCLPPRAKGQPTTILLPQSLADYQTLVRGQGRTLLNPAFFDPERNQIVCAFDWRHMNEELERVHAEHVKLRAKAKECEDELRKAYRGDIPDDWKAVVAEQRHRIQIVETRNRETFTRAQRRLFQRLFHEAFHAYLLNFVYPPREGELPRWLNEGLAQIFETAVFEVGELRIGHADQERLRAVRQALGKNALLPLADLLRSGAKQFQVAHDGDKQVSDRYYLASWALAFYLTFDRKLLGTPALDAYVRQLKRGTDPLEAFRELTGQPLAAFERDFLHYLNHLYPDGRVGAGE
jgi:curved DNA-binding protein CbpA